MKLLIERIALDWLRVYHADLDASGLRASGQDASVRGGHAHRRLDQTHRCYPASLKQLATIRKLLKPAPSPVDMAMHPVAETDGCPSRFRDQVGALEQGVPVLN